MCTVQWSQVWKKLKNVLDMYEVTKVGGNTDSINTDNISKSGIQ